MFRHFGAAAALCLVSSLAVAQSKPDEAKFKLASQSGLSHLPQWE